MSGTLRTAGLLLLQLAVSARARKQQSRAKSGLTTTAVSHAPEESAVMRKDAFEKEFTVDLSLAKAREAGTPLGLEVDIQSEFQRPIPEDDQRRYPEGRAVSE